MFFKKRREKKLVEVKEQNTTEKIPENSTTELIITPGRFQFTEAIERIVWKENGDMTRYYLYSVFPEKNIDGVPVLNIYGQKILNDYTKNKEAKCHV